MKVLVLGASGFIGQRVAEELAARGHEVIRGTRAGGFAFTDGSDVEAWLPRLRQVDAVVNAVGIFVEQGPNTFEAIHVRGPAALFAACVQAGVKRVVQVSALGADEKARSRFHLSKRQADENLLRLPIASAIALPSLVYGEGGRSARVFNALASLPRVPVPGHGEWQVQPIHVDDLCEALAALVERVEISGRIPLVGPEPLSLRGYLAALREGLGLGTARFLSFPLAFARLGARLAPGLGGAEALDMLVRGNVADAAATRRLLGRNPRPVSRFIAPGQARNTSTLARLAWLKEVLRLGIAFTWLAAGVLSLGVFPVEESYALLARTGVPSQWHPVLLYGAAAFDLALGIATLIVRGHRLLWLAQIALIVAYTAIITVWLPEFWLHPFGPVAKNVPVLAVLWLLYELEDRGTKGRWTTRR